jgi:HEPN domain-containing protein
VNKSDLEQLAAVRIEEAKVLLDAKKPDGAYYLAGYAVECALKACIAALTRQYDYPDKGFAQDCYTHKIEDLMKLAEMRTQWNADTAADPDLKSNWQVAANWSETARYSRKTQEDAQALYNAITDGAHGVFPWVKRHW